MNIIDALEEDIEIFEFDYLGVDDFGTKHEVKGLIDKNELICDYFNKEIDFITSVDEFIDCLYLEKYAKFTELKTYVNPDLRETFDKVVDFIVAKSKTIKPEMYIKFLQIHYKDVLGIKSLNLLEKVFEMCFTYSSGLSNAVKYLIINYYYLVLDKFEKVRNIVLRNEEYLNLFLDVKQFDEIKTYRLEEYLAIIEWLYLQEKYKGKLDLNIKAIINYGEGLYKQISVENVLHLEQDILSITEFLNKIKNKDAVRFCEYCERFEDLREEYVKKYGKSISYEIPLKKLIEPFEDKKISWVDKLRLLTHTRAKDGRWISCHEDIVTDKTVHFADLAGSA